MANQSADEAKKSNIEKMGEPLGAVYSALWQAVAIAFVNWKDYTELFGTNAERITILNRAAPAFFRMIQDELWEISLLHLARLTDPAQSPGKLDKSNLTVLALPALIADEQLKGNVSKLVGEATKTTAFCRDWRNRHIAHRDLKLALEQPTEPLADGSREQIKVALDAIAAVLNRVANHYLKSETRFDVAARHDGALTLLYLMDQGLAAKDAKAARLEKGEPLAGDLEIRRL
jgi:hypothetical protein